MRKAIITVMVILIVSIFVGCEAGEESLKKSDIRISYISASSISIYLWIESFNEIGGEMADWSVQVKGNGRTLLTLNNSNSAIYWKSVRADTRVNAYKTSYIYLQVPIKELGKNPDTILGTVHIKDDNGHAYTLERSAGFQYRNVEGAESH